jgi:hypothetical protein
MSRSPCLPASWIAAAAAVAIALSLAFPGCAGKASKVDEPAIAASSLGTALRASWRAAGGLPAWKGIAEVRFAYQATAQPEVPQAGSPGLRTGPVEISFAPGDRKVLEVGGRRLSLEDPPGPDLADYLPRSVRVLAFLPFVLAEGGWEFRQDVVGGGKSDPWTFFLIPTGWPSPHRAYLIQVDRATGDLVSVHYQTGHPSLAGKILKASFGEYRTFDGIRLPTEIVTSAIGPGPDPGGRYPWEPPPRSGAAGGRSGKERPILREQISAVRILPVAREAPAP